MENNNLENYRDTLMKLGEMMFSLYEGEELTEEQINLIKNATDKQKLLAMEMVAFSSLEGKKYTNYCRNKRKINDPRIRNDLKEFIIK